MINKPENEEILATVFVNDKPVYSMKQSIETAEIYREMAADMSKIKTTRGGGNIKGFYAEHMNAADHNVSNVQKNVKARRKVIDDNRAADAETIYSNMQKGRAVQNKVGYTKSQIKDFISSGKYDGQILELNPDHPLFSAQQTDSLKELKALAKEHGITIKKGSRSDAELSSISEAAKLEGQFRKSIHLDNNAPIVSHINGLKSTFKAATPKAMKAGKCAASFGAGLAIGNDIYTLIETDMEIKEIIALVGKDVAVSAASSAAAAVVSEYAIAGASYIAAEAVGTISGMAIAQSVSGTMLTIMGSIGKISVLFPTGAGPMFIAGLAVGAAVSTVKVIRSYRSSGKSRKRDTSRYVSLCNRCETIIKEQTAQISDEIKQYYDRWDENFNRSFSRIINCSLNFDTDGIANALNCILKQYHSSVPFDSLEKFDRAFFDENYVFQL